jgi:hypothetical protein
MKRSDHAVHERTVVSYQQELCRPGAKKARQPANGNHIEIVGGLIEKHQIGLGDEHPGEVETNLVSPGKKLGRPVHVVPGKAQAGEDPFGPPRFPAAFLGQSQCDLFDRGRLRELQVLLEMPDPVPPGNRDFAGVGAFLAHDHSQERGLAMPVAADQAHAFAPVDGKGEPVKEGLVAERFVYAVY